MTNTNLTAAKKAKNDEFYTQLSDIEKELRFYKKHFEGKVVYCNCDDHEWSQFPRVFGEVWFKELKLKKVIATHFSDTGDAFKAVFEAEGGKVVTKLEGNGDFRSPECIEFLKEADIVVTNPPFSLFREFVALIAEHGKEFLVIGNKNAITYKECFKLIKNNQM